MATATILIKDEVNCKIQNLDLSTRQKLVKKFKYEVPYARHLPAVKLGRWDGKVPFFQVAIHANAAGCRYNVDLFKAFARHGRR